jgi:hypothetical protein
MKRMSAGVVFACIVFLAIAVVAQERSSPDPQKMPAAVPTPPAATRPTEKSPRYAGQRPDEWASYQAMHAYFLERFVSERGFGLERMIGVNDPRYRKVYADGMRYTVGRVELISLNGGDAPFAYVTAIDADKRQIQHAAHEALMEGEADALTKLKDGMTVVLTGGEGHREMVGAIRATADCRKCHDAAEGTLLGAFRYPLRPEPTKQRARPIDLIQSSGHAPPTK